MNETNKTPPDAGFRNQRIYHLTRHGTLAQEIHLQLEQAGVDLELLESVDELSELLQALPADLLLIDAEFADDVLRIGGMIGEYRRQHPKYLTAVQLLAADAATTADRFAMMDAVISGTADARGVVGRGHAHRVEEVRRPVRPGAGGGPDRAGEDDRRLGVV